MQLPFVGAAPGGPVAVSLGPSQRSLPTDPVLPIRVRSSGGGAVLLGPWHLRALLVLPRPHPLLRRGPSDAAAWFGEVHREWLAAHGIQGECYRGTTRSHWVCFAGQASGEVLVDGRKITGVAQTWRRRRALLWSATLVTTPPWLLLCDTLRRPLDEAKVVEAVTVSAEECLGHVPPVREWAADLTARLRTAVDAVAAD